MKKILLFSLVMLLTVGAAGCKKSHKGHHNDDDDDDASKSEMSDSCASASTSTSESAVADFSYEDDPEAYEDILADFLEAIEYEKNFDNEMAQNGINDPGLLRELKTKLPNKLASIYSKYLSANELKKLTNVMHDDVYKHFREKQPLISQDYNQAGAAIARGETSPIERIEVSSEFAEAMEKLLDAQDFEKQMVQLRPVLEQYPNMTPDLVNAILDRLPRIMTNIYSKYFSVNDIKQLTIMEKIPVFKKYREKEVEITKEIMKEVQKMIRDYYNAQSAVPN